MAKTSRKKNTAKYVDGFAFVVPKKNVAAYRKMARDAGKLWMKYGALNYKECMLDDPKPEFVTFTFPKMTKAKPSETVWFSYIEHRSKRHESESLFRSFVQPAVVRAGQTT